MELDLRHLKLTLGMDVLCCRTEDSVRKATALFALVYHLVRAVIVEDGRRHAVPGERISFVDALRWRATSPPGIPQPRLAVNPIRPDRVEPRCQKRRGKNYP